MTDPRSTKEFFSAAKQQFHEVLKIYALNNNFPLDKILILVSTSKPSTTVTHKLNANYVFHFTLLSIIITSLSDWMPFH